MSEPSKLANERYARLIEAMLAGSTPPFLPQAEDESSVQVERALVLPMAMTGAEPQEIDRVMERLLRPGSRKARVVDASGQSRPAYPGLLVYAWKRARDVTERELRRQEPTPPELDEWERRLRRSIERTHDLWKAGSGTEFSAAVVDYVWSILGAGAGDLSPVITMQGATGAFLPDNPSVNPETRWYHEFVLLQAIAAYGYLRGDSHALAAADRAAMYHLNETQPDHATAEPWGLLAFIHNADTHLLADQLLHTVQVQQPAGPRGVTRVLLADTLLCLRHPPPG